MPFGEEITSEHTSQRSVNLNYGEDGIKQKFTSYERDNETELDYAQARYYSKNLGRFNSADNFLNDTRVSDTQSWNLYVYVRNNPLTLIDPSGEEVYNTNLSEEEQKKLIEDYKNKTGYKNIYFDPATNKLVIDTEAGFEGGSKSARKLLSDAVGSTEKRFNLTSVDSKDVAFAEVDAGTINSDSAGKKV